MKKITILGLAILFISAGTANPPEEYVTLSGQTYKLDRSPDCFRNPSCLRGASTIAKEVVMKASAQMETASKEVKVAEKNIEKHVAAVADYTTDAGKVATDWTNFLTGTLVPHNEDAFKQRAANLAAVQAIERFNLLPAELQSASEATRLTNDLNSSLEWGKRVNDHVITMIEQVAPIIEDKEALVERRKELLLENAKLSSALKMAQFKEGEAYRQLLKCADYAREINEQLRKYSMQNADMIELNDADATLKNNSNKMFGQGNNHTGSVLARPGFSVSPNVTYSTEPYKIRAERLINALPPGQRTAVTEVKKPGGSITPKAEPPSPAVDKSTSPGVVQNFLNWVKKQ
jgi:hypothetical protein